MELKGCALWTCYKLPCVHFSNDCYVCMHPSFFFVQLHFSLFVLTYIHIVQVLHFVRVFRTKEIVFCLILIQPQFKIFHSLRYKMFVPQANLKLGVSLSKPQHTLSTYLCNLISWTEAKITFSQFSQLRIPTKQQLWRQGQYYTLTCSSD
jgi:hypothetical protein